MLEPINILLLVEDDENDVIITERKIARSNIQINEILVATTVAETKALLLTKKVDVLLLDLNLPDSQGLDTVDIVRSIYSGILVVLTSIDDEQVGVDAIKRGADEFLIKSQLTEKLLVSAIYHAFARASRQATTAKVHETLNKLEELIKK